MMAIVAFDIVGCTGDSIVDSTGRNLKYVWGLCGLFILESSTRIGTVDCHLHFHRSSGNARFWSLGEYALTNDGRPDQRCCGENLDG